MSIKKFAKLGIWEFKNLRFCEFVEVWEFAEFANFAEFADFAEVGETFAEFGSILNLAYRKFFVLYLVNVVFIL